MDKQLIGFNLLTGKVHMINPKAVDAWAWGKQMRNYMFYIADETGINEMRMCDSNNIKNIQFAVDVYFDEPCQG